MLTLDIGQRVTHRRKEILVCSENSSVYPEFDYRLRAVDRGGDGVRICGSNISLVAKHYEPPNRQEKSGELRRL
jgi:hypothetical protein